MNLNKKYVSYGLVLLLLFWSGNVIYYKNQVIKEPLFIKHYYDVMKGMNNFQLYYIQNLNSQSKIKSIIFPEVGQQNVNFTEYDGNTDKRYYVLKNITVNIFDGDVKNMPNYYKNKVITKARIEFSDGKIMNVDVGKIYIYGDEINGGDLEARNQSSSIDNTGSENTGNSTFKVNKDIKITGINSRFDKEIKNILQINVNGKSLSNIKFPINLKKGDEFYINYTFNFNKDIIMKNNAYSFPLNISTQDLKGNKGSASCFVNSYLQSPEYFDIDVLKSNLGRK